MVVINGYSGDEFVAEVKARALADLESSGVVPNVTEGERVVFIAGVVGGALAALEIIAETRWGKRS